MIKQRKNIFLSVKCQCEDIFNRKEKNIILRIFTRLNLRVSADILAVVFSVDFNEKKNIYNNNFYDIMFADIDRVIANRIYEED